MKINIFKLTSIALMGVFSITNVMAQQFSSSDSQTPLVELYTSEGCSSCPPAERWLSGLKSQDGLWSEFVPLAFHVDYWDYIGWKDRFASPEYSQRQRRYAKENQEATVYTPGVRRAGQEFRGWRRNELFIGDAAEQVGKLSIDVAESGGFQASFENSTGVPARLLNVALLGLDLETEVQRGENRGKTLEHDFVVLSLSRFSSTDDGRWSGQLHRPKEGSKKYAIAAWVSDGRSVSPIQATGGFLADGLSLPN